ncbi:MAG: hypothetical protein ABIC57_00040 [bacterium]
MGIFNKSKQSKEKEKQSVKDGSASEKKVRTINLIPKPTQEEIDVVVRKDKRSISGVSFIALIIFVAVSILGFNLWSKLRLNQVEQTLVDAENEIKMHQLEEIQKKTLDNKLLAYQSVKNEDFNADNVLSYLLEVAEGLSDVKTLFLDNTLKFEMTGSASSYTNVARLWHDMTREEKYFESISLERVSRSQDTGKVSFNFSGYVIKDKVEEM